MPRFGWLSIPRVCVVCGRYTRAPIDCCLDCERDLPAIRTSCERCGRGLSAPQKLCDRCVMALPAFDAAWAAFRFEGIIARLLDRFKNRADLSAGHVLAGLMARRWQAQRRPTPDWLIPVPMHWTRFWVRGFQHTHCLTRDVARHLGGVPWRVGLKARQRTPRQSTSSLDTRWINVHNTLALKSSARSLAGCSVALIDDVMVTGATAHEAARVLKHHGVKRVEVWVVARGEEGESDDA